jgi:hypothetical protein
MANNVGTTNSRVITLWSLRILALTNPKAENHLPPSRGIENSANQDEGLRQASTFLDGVCELRHITLARIDLFCRFSLDCDPSPMTGPFLRSARPRAGPASPRGAPIHFECCASSKRTTTRWTSRHEAAASIHQKAQPSTAGRPCKTAVTANRGAEGSGPRLGVPVGLTAKIRNVALRLLQCVYFGVCDE